MKLAAVVVAILTSAFTFSAGIAEQQACRAIAANAGSILEDCGTQLRSFVLSLDDSGRQPESGAYGGFIYSCPLEPMCTGQPSIVGFFISPGPWNNGSRDVRAIYETVRNFSLYARIWSLDGRPPSALVAACPIFDVSVGGMAGRAICYDAGDFGAVITVVAADDQTGLVLTFSQRDQAVGMLREKGVELLSRFHIERSTGDKALLKWIRR